MLNSLNSVSTREIETQVPTLLLALWNFAKVRWQLYTKTNQLASSSQHFYSAAAPPPGRRWRSGAEAEDQK